MLQNKPLPAKLKNKLLSLRKTPRELAYPSLFFGSIGFILLCLVGLNHSIGAPQNFPVPSTIIFEKDQSVGSLVDQLQEKEYIRYKIVFKIFLKLSGQDDSIKAGSYYFDQPLDVNILAHRFAVGDLNQKTLRLTIPEGSTNAQIIGLVQAKLPLIREQDMQAAMKGKEGVLFPETYFFEPDVSALEIVDRMYQEYTKKVIPVLIVVGATDEKTQKNIIIMASLLEEEGKTLEDKQKIAGVLLRRLRIGMPLQVDATINYIKGEASSVTFKDLELKSVYNTYQNKGLPPAAISNPGLVSVRAALTPVDTGALYYLTGKDGVFYFSKTFEQHVRNKERYLR